MCVSAGYNNNNKLIIIIIIIIKPCLATVPMDPSLSEDRNKYIRTTVHTKIKF